MSSILEVLTEDSRRLVVDQFPFLRTDFKTCWYPSCGYDFRHIKYYAGQGFDDFLYVNTDMLTLNVGRQDRASPNPLFEDVEFECEHWSCLVRATEFFELELKEDLWCPNMQISEFRYEEGNFGKVFLFNLTIDREKAEIPLLFFCYENTNFFYDHILENRIYISHLFHVKDGGGSMGGSRFPMGYLYRYLDEMRTQEIIIDGERLEDRFDWYSRYFDGFEHRNPRRTRPTWHELYGHEMDPNPRHGRWEMNGFARAQFGDHDGGLTRYVRERRAR